EIGGRVLREHRRQRGPQDRHLRRREQRRQDEDAVAMELLELGGGEMHGRMVAQSGASSKVRTFLERSPPGTNLRRRGWSIEQGGTVERRAAAASSAAIARR